MFESFREKLKHPEPRIAQQQDFLTLLIDGMKTATMGAFPVQTKEALKEATSWLSGVESSMWENMFKFYTDAGLLTKEQADHMMKLKDTCTPMDIVFFIVIALRLFGTYMDGNTNIGSNFLAQGLNKEHRSNLPDPREVMPAAFIAPEKAGEVREICKRMGYKDEDIDLLFLALYRIYDEDTVKVLFLRGVLSEDEMFMRMRELGYTDVRIKEIIQSWPIIPGPSDLFHLVAKEAFEPDSIKEMGLDAEFPVEQVEWLRKQGISQEWALKYWYAHWEMPSLQMGFQMLHRGVIDHDQLNTLFKTVEIPPYWRDKLTAIAYQPYTRVDVRRMHDMGVLTDEELIRAYKDVGYDEEHALKMAQFTVKYNQAGDKEITKSQIMTGFKQKILSKADTLELLIDLEYTEAQAEYIILLEEYKETKALQDDMLDNIKLRYQNNFADEFETRSRLGSINLPAAQISILMDKWKIKKLIDVKIPSKTDLDKFLVNKIINLDTYRIEMTRLGYNPKYTDWYEQLVGMKGAK